MNTKLLIITIVLISILYCFAIATNITPYLRGFAPYPQWQWPYHSANLTYKLMLPLLVIAITLFFARFILSKPNHYILTHEKRLLFFICSLCFVFQLSALYACNGGVFILVQRTINPAINGYFAASLKIHSLPNFFRNYQHMVSGYQSVAEYHPPGSILLYWCINQFSAFITSFVKLPPSVQPSHTDLRILWNALSPSEKVGGFLAGYIVILLTALTSTVLYYLGKLHYTSKIGLQAALLYVFLPSITFFTPFTDVFFALFSALSFYFFLKGLKKRSPLAFFVSGVILFIGTFFTLTMLATILIYAVVAINHILAKKLAIKEAVSFASVGAVGFLILPLVLYLAFGFNSIASLKVILQNHLSFVKLRQNLPLWLIYNYYDFFMFFGIPLLIVFLLKARSVIVSMRNKNQSKDAVFIGFLLMTLLIDISGKMNGETGRTWILFIPFVLLPLVIYLDEVDRKAQYYLILLFMQGVQVLTLATYLITIS